LLVGAVPTRMCPTCMTTIVSFDRFQLLGTLPFHIPVNVADHHRSQTPPLVGATGCSWSALIDAAWARLSPHPSPSSPSFGHTLRAKSHVKPYTSGGGVQRTPHWLHPGGWRCDRFDGFPLLIALLASAGLSPRLSPSFPVPAGAPPTRQPLALAEPLTFASPHLKVEKSQGLDGVPMPS
jgi:hypothetical protein